MCPGSDDDEPKVDWEGYVENASDPILADRVRIRVPDGDTPGFVMFGSGPALPMPTQRGEVFACVDPQQRWLVGHRYEMLEPIVSDRRLRFKIWQAEPYAPWCELQDPKGACGHVNKVWASPCLDSRDREVDCELMLLCTSCTCDAHACHAISDLVNDFTSNAVYTVFDIALYGDRAQGSASLVNWDGPGKLLLYATE